MNQNCVFVITISTYIRCSLRTQLWISGCDQSREDNDPFTKTQFGRGAVSCCWSGVSCDRAWSTAEGRTVTGGVCVSLFWWGTATLNATHSSYFSRELQLSATPPRHFVLAVFIFVPNSVTISSRCGLCWTLVYFSPPGAEQCWINSISHYVTPLRPAAFN